MPLSGQTANALETAVGKGPAQEISNILEGDVDLELQDDQSLVIGTGDDAEILWSTADASTHTLVLALSDTTQSLHVTDVGAKATDWAIAADTHPTQYIHSNTTPTTDYLKIGAHDGTTAHIEAVGGTLNLTGVGEVVVNEASADVNFRVESNALANFLLVDAAECLNGTLSIGAAAPTNPQCMLALVPPANATGVTANQSYFHGQVLPGGAVTIPAGTAPVVASLNIHEPNVTATGTVTDAATVRIVDAPTEGGTGNYALWVDAGLTRLDGNATLGALVLGAAAPTNPQAFMAVLPPTNAAGVTTNQSYFHGQVLPGGATTIPAGTAPVVASLNIHEPNITATGTVTAAATVRIVDAPTEGTTNWALWVDAGAARIDERLNIGGTAADAQLTTGIIIDQVAADDNVLSFKSSTDVAHGMTTDYETDTYGAVRKFAGADGGLKVVGLSDATVALEIFAAGATADATDAPTTTSTATLTLNGAKKSGTSFGALADGENLLNVENLGTAEFVVKGDGELYSNQSATVGTFDDYNDALACADLSYVLSREYEKITQHGREFFRQVGIISDDPDGKGGMYSITKMSMLVLCACGQLGRQIEALAKHVGLDFKKMPGGINLLPGPKE